MKAFTDYFSYLTGTSQKWILFLDTLRKRGNNYYEHLEEGQPPVLIFDYEIISDGRTFDHPVNYALLEILDRRSQERRVEDDTRLFPVEMRENERRFHHRPSEEKQVIVIIDPRAGHGPGIGGSKLLSQIGLALDYGATVYFVSFFSKPEPNQSITDVQQAEILFLEEIARRHPGIRPFVIGNCQGGWAAALLAADRPDLIRGFGPNGSPISYWAGKADSQPMRNRGALSGGAWVTRYLSDLGHGRFDGAHLVAGFEQLNPTNSLLTKFYNLYSDPATAVRYLNFEKWWGGLYWLNEEEINFIASKLFIANELEQGTLCMKDGRKIDLRNLQNMVIEIFASDGDNITPTPQALAWLLEVFQSDQEIADRNLKIIYSVHKKIGHLGIFVGGEINGKQQRELIGGIEMFELLPPGIYELVFQDNSAKCNGSVYDPATPDVILYNLKVVARKLEDIRKLCGTTDKAAFSKIDQMSKHLDCVYCNFVRPWVRLYSNELTAELLEQAHPLRLQHQILSDRNPFMWPIKYWAPMIQHTPIAKDNMFLRMEKVTAEYIKDSMDSMTAFRDETMAFFFKSFFMT